jgi:hypothetical protein
MSNGEKKSSRKFTISTAISLFSLILAVTAMWLATRKPAPVAQPQSSSRMAANVQSFQQKVGQLAEAQSQGQGGSEVHLTASEVTAAIAQANGGEIPTSNATVPVTADAPATTDSSALASASLDLANMPEPIVTFEGDQVKGQFLTQVGGKQVYVTVAGHLGAKDGYASFEPTEFKVGDLNVPVSLVNEALQKKLLEQRDRLKLPDYVSDLRVENGELVVKQK